MQDQRRRRIVSFTGLLALMLLLFGPGHPLRAQGGSLALLNPSFEDGVTNWATQPACAYTTYAGTTAYPAQSESYFMAANRDGSSECQSIYQAIDFAPEPSTTYRFGLWIRSGVSTARAGTLRLTALGGTLSEVGTANFSATSGLWQCVEVSLRPSSPHTSLRVEIGMTTLTSGDFHLDNALIQATTSPICPQIGEGSARQPLFASAYARNGNAASLGTATQLAQLTGASDENGLARVQQLSGGALLSHEEQRDVPFQSVPAYLLPEPFLAAFRDLGGPTSWLGAGPTSDRFLNGAEQFQVNFPAGKMYLNGSTMTVSSWPISTTGQWYAEYHNGSSFSGGPTWVQNEAGPALEHFWGDQTPGNGDWGVWNNNFVARWTGRFNFSAGDYRFIGGADDSLKVWVDDELILVSNLTEVASMRSMSAGQHTVRVEMVEIDGGANMFFEWAAVPSCTLIINNGKAFTNQRLVSVRSNAPATAEQLLANNSVFTGAAWQPYQATSAWTLADPGAQVATLPVFGRYRTAQGTSPCEPDPSETDSIIYDPLPPTIAASISGSLFQVVLSTSATDQAGGSGVQDMQISLNPSFTNAVWRVYDTRVSLPPPINRTWYVRVRDGAGNISRTVIAGVRYRTFLPMLRR